MSGAERIIVALDRASSEANVALVRALAGRAAWFKVGMRQFYAGAEPVLDAIRETDARLFLDLKLHDIPATVAGAVRSLERVQPDLLTLHASGGTAMIAAAREACAERTRLLAVTVLTSLSDDDASALGWSSSAAETVGRWGQLAVEAGAHGLVCSGQEAHALRERLGPDALLVTPGIRPAGADVGDQKRVMTPAAALTGGASLLVIGRPIHGASDPVAAFEAIADECAGAVGADA